MQRLGKILLCAWVLWHMLPCPPNIAPEKQDIVCKYNGRYVDIRYHEAFDTREACDAARLEAETMAQRIEKEMRARVTETDPQMAQSLRPGAYTVQKLRRSGNRQKERQRISLGRKNSLPEPLWIVPHGTLLFYQSVDLFNPRGSHDRGCS
jgi:hypothetical protein